jgi:flagellar biogenesis protein FliO
VREFHYRHSLTGSFREVGNMPPIRARVLGQHTVVVGITWVDDEPQVFVLAVTRVMIELLSFLSATVHVARAAAARMGQRQSMPSNNCAVVSDTLALLLAANKASFQSFVKQEQTVAVPKQ